MTTTTSCRTLEDWEKLAHETQYKVLPFAQRLGLSPRQLRRHSRQLFGCSTREFLADARTRKAEQDLKFGRPPKEVAAEVHLKQTASLYHLFKRRTGRTPGDYSAGVPALPPERRIYPALPA
jgi:AraC-like DNA-binding protein